MANSVIQLKRTSVAGRAANSTTLTRPGELALNMADQIMYSTNGTTIFEVGANNTNLRVTGNATIKAIIANGSLGTLNQVLHSNGSAIYWDTDVYVTSVSTGNGLTGGPITTTGTVSVLANTGIVANTTGTFVNATYIGTLSANNTTYVNGKTEGNLNVNNATTAYGKVEGALNVNNATYFGGALSNTFIKNNSVVQYFNPFIPSNTINKYYSSITTNRFLGRASQLYVTVDGVASPSTASAISDGSFDGGIVLGTAGGANVVLNINFVTNGLTGSTGFVYSSGEIGVYFYPGRHPTALTARYKDKDGIWTTATVTNIVWYSVDVIGFRLTNIPGNYVTDVEITMTPQATQSIQLAEIEYHGSRMGLSEGPFVTVGGANFYGTVNHTANITISNTGNMVFSPNAGIVANNSFGTSGHTLHSNGTSVYWAADDQGVTSVSTGNGLTGGPITTTGTVSVLANTGIVANTTGTFVNAAYIATISANNSTYLNGKLEAGLNVNSATSATTATNATQLNSKTEGNLNVNNATTAYGKTENALNVNSATTATNANNSTFINGNSVITVMESLRANRNVTGGGTFTVDSSGNVLWSSRLIVISNGRGTHFATAGYYDITCPTSGTITGVGGSANKTATAAGVPLAAWDALYYILPINGTNTTVAANFRVASYTSDLEIPSNWVLLCVRNGDTGQFHFNNGVTLALNQSYNSVSFNSSIAPYANNSGNLNGKTEGNLNVNNATTAYGKTEGNLNVNSATNATTATNATQLGSVAAANYVQNTDSRTLSGNLVFSGANVNFTGNARLSGGVIANSSLGTAGQVLATNGTTVYWTTAGGGGSTYMKGGSTTVGTLAVEGQNLFRVNANTLNFDTTFVAGENAQATGPITVAAGKTLTIESGARVAIV